MVWPLFGMFLLLWVALYVGYRYFYMHAGSESAFRPIKWLKRVLLARAMVAWLPLGARIGRHGEVVWRQLWHSRRWLQGLFLLLLGVPMLGWWANRAINWADAPEQLAPTRVAEVLTGDALVPPPTLPPEAFAAVEAEIPMISTANRQWEQLDKQFSPMLIRMLAQLEMDGYRFVVIEGYRSPERQEMLANIGQHVTKARAFQSYHQFGLAADLAPVKDGKIIISEKNPWAAAAYQQLGRRAAEAGLVWGGGWKMADLMHVELHLPRAVPRQRMPEAIARADAAASAVDAD